MNRLSLAIVCGLMVTTAGSAGASVPMPIEHSTGQLTVAPLLRKLLPAVVTVSARVFEQRGAVVSERTGSGVVFDGARGYLITNNHVIDRANTIAVVLADGRALAAKVVGSDLDTDVAVIKVDADRLVGIDVGDSDRLEIGDFVLAIGNPNNIGETVTSGIIGGLHRGNLGSSNMKTSFKPTQQSIRATGRRAGQSEGRTRRHQYRVYWRQQYQSRNGFCDSDQYGT